MTISVHFHFTKHADEKFKLLAKFGFKISKSKIQQTIEKPLKIEQRPDNTFIATTFLDENHMLRVVYRIDPDGIIIVITFYPEGKNPMDYKYDPESDILAITIANKPFSYAEEMGDFIVHFDRNNKPVYLEILNAKSFINKTKNISKLKQPESHRFISA